MENNFINGLKSNKNLTENGAVALSTTGSKLYDLFALGAAYRERTEHDCILLFKEAYEENPSYALKCLSYIRDINEGQGERRFFRACIKWLAIHDPEAVERNIKIWVEGNYCRWDDLFVLFDTPCEKAVMHLIMKQFIQDIKWYEKGEPVSLFAKWAPSCNASSKRTKYYGKKIIKFLGISEKEYRQLLSKLRERIRVVERLMSQQRWNEIDFEHLPSRAGLLYKKAFASREETAERYRQFAMSKNTVNASVLYPYDILHQVVTSIDGYWSEELPINSSERLMINKYWDNLPNTITTNDCHALVVCDTSGSMLCGTRIKPIDVAVSLAIYTAERAKGPFYNHYISFSSEPRLVEIKGIDFYDKALRIISEDLCEDTNLQGVFQLVLSNAINNHLSQEDMPESLIVISDMQVNVAIGNWENAEGTLGREFMEAIRKEWEHTCKKVNVSYSFPRLVFWDVNAKNNTFLQNPNDGVTYISGCSPVLLQQVMSGISGMQLMEEILNKERYSPII